MQVCLSFYEKRQRQNWLGIGGSQEERLYWEQWCINLAVLDPKISQSEQSSFTGSTGKSCCAQRIASSVFNSLSGRLQQRKCAVRQQRHSRLESALESLLTHIVRLVNEKKEHVPPVVVSNTLTFPFDISIAGCVTLLAVTCSILWPCMHSPC